MAIKYGLDTFAISLMVIWTIMMYTLIKGVNAAIKRNRKALFQSICIIIAGVSMLIFLRWACFVHEINIKPRIDVSPITELNMPWHIKSVEDIFADKFISYKIQKAEGNYIGERENRFRAIEKFSGIYSDNPEVWIHITTYESFEDAIDAYEYEHLDYEYKIIRSEESPNGQYFVTLMTKERSDPEGGSELESTFDSTVMFRKSNVVVTIFQSTTKSRDSKMQEAINFVTEHLKQAR